MIPRPPESCTVQTPAPLARAMVKTLGDDERDLWLDPCVGKGVFVQALADMNVKPNRITAVDLDPTPEPMDKFAQIHRGVDFLAWPYANRHRFTKIVANPPYVALEKLDPVLQKTARSVMQPDGQAVRLDANYWYAFLCASLTVLQAGGDICFVLPAAWDYADYAAPLRSSLAKGFAQFEIYRSSKPMFESVQEGCIVIVGKGYHKPHQEFRRFEYDSVEFVIEALGQEQRGKANTVAQSRARPKSKLQFHQEMTRLGDILNIRLGGVTGDANYFLLTESERLIHELPKDSLRPVVSKARHLVSAKMTAREWERLRRDDQRVWLFDAPPHMVSHPLVSAYLELTPELGGCQRERFKIQSREPWYRTPLPHRVDGFMSGMSQLGPWICLRRMPRLTATNTLYTVAFEHSLSEDQKAAWALSLLTSSTRRAFQSVGRTYAQGLLKFEPSDLTNVHVLTPTRYYGAEQAYVKAIRALLHNDPRTCTRIADKWFQSNASDRR